jgi:hypothetical protein
MKSQSGPSREERLAAALRENLKRRKTKERAGLAAGRAKETSTTTPVGGRESALKDE